MCGIVGLVSFRYNTNPEIISQDILERMSSVLFHRGPDSNGIWISDDYRCGLGFRRLSIIDLTPAANQPMLSANGDVAIVFNGEIYNFQEIRAELENYGYKFKSRSDTEVILNGYLHWGTSVLNKLSGMFSFAIWDNRKKILFGARDRLGKKPFYYTFTDGLFAFASEIKSLLLHPKISPRPNFSLLPIYLNFGTSCNNETLFEGIKKLPPAHYFILDDKGEIKTERYWNPFALVGEFDNITIDEASQQIINMLRQAIKDRMISDVPFGVFLSGGIDSSLNVALMAELMNRPVDTFTVGFKELEKYNELEYANKIVQIFGTNHHEILIDERDAFEVLEKIVWHEDEPNADPVCIPLFFLSKLTRESGTIVIQVGEGSDEQFVGYPWLLRDYKFYNSFWKYYSFIPNHIKRLIYFLSSPLFAKTNNFLPLEILRRASYNQEFYWSGTPIIPPAEAETLLINKKKINLNQPWEYIQRLRQEVSKLMKNIDFLRWVLFVEINQRLPELLLMRVDKIGMANSIEARVPFLDYRLVEFTMALPEKIKLPTLNETKFLLKKAVEGILPNEIIYRKKQGFWAPPLNEWLREAWFEYASSKINNSNLFNAFFNLDYVNKILRMHRDGKINKGFQIYTLLKLAIWYVLYLFWK